MAKKKYLLKQINFGKETEPARILVEKYIKLNGDQKLSKLIRELVVVYLSNKKEFKNYKIELLLSKRKNMKLKMRELGKEILNNAKKLNSLGLKNDEFE